MDLINATGMQAAYTQGLQPDGRELLVVVVKGTFTIPDNGGEPRLADEQQPLVMADTFTGEPGLSAPVYEAEFAPVKKRCDVLLNGTAYAPGGTPAKRVTVGLKVGSMEKVFDVVGDRVWVAQTSGIVPSMASPFVTKPISYDYAFGGVDNFHRDESKHSAYMANPVGRGYHRVLSRELIDGTPLPNTEERGVKVSDPQAQYRPMSFGPVGRGWEPRYKLAGTYDQKWMDDTFPFLPVDFDDAYYQSAPDDQQVDKIVGGEDVVLLNLTEDGRRSFKLPSSTIPVVYLCSDRDDERHFATIDTVLLEPECERLSMTWRSTVPIRRNIFEIAQVVVGQMPRAWWRAVELEKQHFPSISEVVIDDLSLEE